VPRTGRGTWSSTAALVGLLTFAGCGSQDQSTARITSLQVVNESCKAGLCGLPRLDGAKIKVTGQGVCSFRLDLGDSRFLDVSDYDFGNGPRMFNFWFAGSWPGPKTITAFGEKSCVGRYSVLHHVFTDATLTREDWTVAMNMPRELCVSVPGPGGADFPPLRPATRVHITAATMPEVKFGTFTHYGPDGQPGSSAPNSFPFPGYRKYSLILDVGNEVHQGGTNATFTVLHGGELFLCQNDDDWSDNEGGWEVDLRVDESQAP
jgi:hypothetical protein